MIVGQCNQCAIIYLRCVCVCEIDTDAPSSSVSCAAARMELMDTLFLIVARELILCNKFSRCYVVRTFRACCIFPRKIL